MSSLAVLLIICYLGNGALGATNACRGRGMSNLPGVPGTCYVILTDRERIQEQCMTSCSERGGLLLAIENLNKLNAVQKVIADEVQGHVITSGKCPVSITGELQDTTRSCTWRGHSDLAPWTIGETIKQGLWVEDENYDHQVIQLWGARGYKMDDVPTDRRGNCFCEVALECPGGMKLLPGVADTCYWLGDRRKRQNGCLNDCTTKGGNLLAIENMNKLAAVQALLTAKGASNVMTSGSCELSRTGKLKDTTRECHWIGHDDLPTWTVGETIDKGMFAPNEHFDHEVIQLWTKHGYKLDDISTDKSGLCFCEASPH